MLQLYHMDLVETIRQGVRKFAPRATNVLLFILVALIPFSIRYVFDSSLNYETGAYSDFTSISLYFSDLVLLLLIFSFYLSFLDKIFSSPSQKLYDYSTKFKVWVYAFALITLWLILELIIKHSFNLQFQTYFSIRILFLVTLALSISHTKVSREKIAWIFTILGSIQSLIATVQFYTQKSIGMYLLGESHLNPDTLGVAKIVSHGTKLIRGYGTFPHPNLLSAFLVTSILLNLYLLIKKPQLSRGIWLYILLIMNVFGLFLTFSRGGILALGIALIVISSIFVLKQRYFHVKQVVFSVIVSVVLAIIILFPYISTRATFSDSATKERLFYNQVGERIISSNVLFGVGAGMSVFHMKHYSEVALEPWEIQPIHNYYLISLAEWGIGVIPLLFLILFPIFTLFKRNSTDWQLILGSIGISFLILFLFDHYFYTIWPTQLLLWVIIGLSLMEIIIYDKTSQS